MDIVNFILKNADSVVVILIFTVVCVILLKRGENATLNRILFAVVTQVEKEFGSGTGKLKLSKAIDTIYQRIPAVLRLLYSEAEIEKLVETALEKAKEVWATNGKIENYIKEHADT